jgi:hypothetical protein
MEYGSGSQTKHVAAPHFWRDRSNSFKHDGRIDSTGPIGPSVRPASPPCGADRIRRSLTASSLCHVWKSFGCREPPAALPADAGRRTSGKIIIRPNRWGPEESIQIFRSRIEIPTGRRDMSSYLRLCEVEDDATHSSE